MSEWLEVAKAFAPGALLGVVVGYLLSRSEQRRLFRARMLDRSLEKVYGPAFSVVEKPEAKVSFKKGSEDKEPGIMVWENEWKALWEAMMNYPHLLTDEIRQYWLANLKELTSRTSPPEIFGQYTVYYPVRLEFREMVRQEYNRRLKEYRKLTGEN